MEAHIKLTKTLLDKAIIDANNSVSEFEAQVLLNNITFEVAKIIGKLENQTGIDTGLVKRNNAGFVDKQSYKV